jgi:hypothetical protein
MQKRKSKTPCACGCGMYPLGGRIYVSGHRKGKPCACGCGRQALPGQAYIFSHIPLALRRQVELKECSCGCGELCNTPTARYLPGHVVRGRSIRKQKLVAHTGVYFGANSWTEIMKRVYGDVCMYCGWDKATCDVHHILPKALGGEYTLENGIILCPNCHRLAGRNILSVAQLQEAKSKVSPKEPIKPYRHSST